MKIVYAKFTNFKHLYSALGKYEVELDFKDMTNVINVIIGKMGSGKTTILSHLQPWASFGTLDERNSDGIIIEEKNGSKIIDIVDGVDTYHISHQWTWVKDHHTLKSYIMKNDVELNANGNQSSFKELIQAEMGVDQDFLRLSRLGPNVANLIEMTSTERKDFIAERLSDVDLYLTIAKDMNERSRTIAAQTQLLSRRLQNVTDDTMDDMYKTLKDLKKASDKLTKHIEEASSKYNAFIGEMRVYLDGLSIDEYRRAMDSQSRAYDKLCDDIDELISKINSSTAGYNSSREILQRLGELGTLIEVTTKDITAMETGFNSYNDRRNQLIQTKSASVNSEYLQTISDTYSKQVSLVECIENELIGFKCKYSSAEIKALMADVQVFDTLLSDMFDYNRDSVIACYNQTESESRSKISKTIEVLRATKFKLQRSLNNVEYLGHYEAEEELKLPTECMCHNKCPYYRTHPNVVSKQTPDISEKHQQIMNQIEDLDARIDKLSEYPVISKKLSHLKSEFTEICDKLDKLGVVRVKNLKVILTSSNNRVWYDNDEIVNILEKVTKKEQMYAIQIKLPELKAEIDKYSKINLADLTVELDDLNQKITTIKSSLLENETKLKEYKDEVATLNEAMDSLNRMESMKSQLKDLESNRDSMEEKISRMNHNLNEVMTKQNEMSSLKKDIEERSSSLRDINNSISSLTAKIAELESARTEFGTLLRQQEIISLIKEAASSKKGIPLVYVKIFLDDCVGIINELISMVFDDVIEIKEFNITDKEFFIPYYKNGIEISDVKTASQGERSIISLALSFALMRKGANKYNILLLDEIDGALYSKDREKFLMILTQQIMAIKAEQVFLITHNNCFDGYPINIIMTTPEHVDNNDVPMLYV